MHKFIITALLLLFILFAAFTAYFAISGGFSGNFQPVLIQLALICGIIGFVSALLFHLLTTFLKYKNREKYGTMKAHLISGVLLGFIIAVAAALLSLTRWQKEEPISISDFALFLFYPLLGLLTGFIYKLVKD